MEDKVDDEMEGEMKGGREGSVEVVVLPTSSIIALGE